MGSNLQINYTITVLVQKLSHKYEAIYNTWKSENEDIQCGVPQRSKLGLLLFLYMNDICHTSGLLKTILFAGDTTYFYSHKDVLTLYDTVNNGLKEVCNWFKANKQTLKAKKTKTKQKKRRRKKKKNWEHTSKINENYEIHLDGWRLFCV